jgi:hypothetical protein
VKAVGHLPQGYDANDEYAGEEAKTKARLEDNMERRDVNMLGGGSRDTLSLLLLLGVMIIDAIDSRNTIPFARLRPRSAVEKVVGHRMDEDDWIETPAQGSTSDPLVEQEYQRLASRYSDVSLADLEPSCVFRPRLAPAGSN